MPRRPRVDYPGAWHHVMHRGARRQPIFEGNDDASEFLRCMAEAIDRWGLEVHAYSLMPNHYHLLVRSPLGTLSRAMRHLNATFTQRMNRRHGWDGALFRGRFKSQVVQDDEYLDALAAYIHLNPVRANLVMRPDDVCWTSYRAHLGLEAAPDWLSNHYVVDRFGDADGLAEYVLSLHQGEQPWPEQLDLDHGWLRGGQLPPRERREPAPERPTAADVVARVRKVTGVSKRQLATAKRGRGANPARRFSVWALDRETLLSHREIGDLVAMSKQQVDVVLFRLRRGRSAQIAEWITAWDVSA